MSQQNGASIRTATSEDIPFINSLSPTLAGVADLAWHDQKTVEEFQDAYIDEMMTDTDVRQITLIAEFGGKAAGFIHARERIDEISGEDMGTVPLLAVTKAAQGTGLGRLLIEAAELWAKAQGFRLLHLEVFASNEKGMGFYNRLGFQPETINMIKPLK
jgi:GNAT superfamily N-acetyltransferase